MPTVSQQEPHTSENVLIAQTKEKNLPFFFFLKKLKDFLKE